MSPLSVRTVVAGMSLAMALIVGGDAAGKLLTSAGVAPALVAWARFSIAAVLLVPLGLRDWRRLAEWQLWLRAALIAGGIACILTALRSAPMADVFAAFFVGPIIAYGLSVLVLKERVSALRSLLLLLSFAGVLVATRPGFGMAPGIGWAFLAGCLHGGYLVATRWLAGRYRAGFLLWSQLVIGTIILAPLALAAGMPALSLSMGALFVASALGSAAGNLILVQLNRRTEASVLAPLIYTQLPAAALFGWAIFGDLPDAATWIGAAIIVLGGVASVRVARRR